MQAARKVTPLLGLATLATLGLAAAPAARAQTVLDFDSLPSMTYLSGNPIPDDARLSDLYLATDGVVFSSGGGYVAVVDLGDGHATSGTNGIGGSTPDGLLTYDRANPVTATFFVPSDPSQPGVTDFVSVRGDMLGLGQQVTLNAYGTAGNLVGSVTVTDDGGETMAISAPGIHSVEFLGTQDFGGVALDDFTFNSVAPAPEPSQFVGLGTGVLGLAGLALRARKRRAS